MEKQNTKNIQDYFEEKARSGNANFAVAYSLMRLADAHKAVARALDRLGSNNDDPAGPPGTAEKLAMEVSRLAEAGETIAAAIGQSA